MGRPFRPASVSLWNAASDSRERFRPDVMRQRADREGFDLPHQNAEEAPARGSAIPRSVWSGAILQKSVIVRAFELARGGECRSMGDLRKALVTEGYEAVQSHLMSGSLVKQLRTTMKAAEPGDSLHSRTASPA
jgi:hypothetical protein